LYALHPEWAAIGSRTLIWFAVGGGCAGLMLAAALAAWSFAAGRMVEIDAMLREPADCKVLCGWLATAMSKRRQLVLPLVGMVGGPLYLFAISSHLAAAGVSVAIPSYLLVAWLGFIGGNVVYWLWVATEIPRFLHLSSNLALRWHDPAATPGLRLLVDGYSISAIFLLAGIMSLAALAFVPSSLLRVPAASTVLIGVFAIGVASSVRVAVVPFYWIWVIVSHHKRRTLERICERLSSLDDIFDPRKAMDDDQLLRLYEHVARSPALPFNTSVTVQYGAALAGAIVAFLIGLLARGA